MCKDFFRSVPYVALLAFALKIVAVIFVVDSAFKLSSKADAIFDQTELIDRVRKALTALEVADVVLSACALVAMTFTAGKTGETVFGEERPLSRHLCGKRVQMVLRLFFWFFFILTLGILVVFSMVVVSSLIFDVLCKVKPLLAHVIVVLKQASQFVKGLQPKVTFVQRLIEFITGDNLALEGEVSKALDQVAEMREYVVQVNHELTPVCNAVRSLVEAPGYETFIRLLVAPFVLAIVQALFMTGLSASIERIRRAEVWGKFQRDREQKKELQRERRRCSSASRGDTVEWPDGVKEDKSDTGGSRKGEETKGKGTGMFDNSEQEGKVNFRKGLSVSTQMATVQSQGKHVPQERDEETGDLFTQEGLGGGGGEDGHSGGADRGERPTLRNYAQTTTAAPAFPIEVLPAQHSPSRITEEPPPQV
uniref:Transmembrane protein n=1 Tax=Chromera velia CCMP2878 TaxID=1169474 RepID=A0A0G4F9G1_9ALVE|eukprot:Cvel_15864.t1-p1 / transcript=Cvel_15864.t1 / gene=Cvel_15864 / organism=Chromera_velia_CCMP2878 / gene_product=hypothetical protein / transcript_product=hypothetical protein / location=Cvel_scaffold1196:19728-20990(-) / protein_length=421 / sequence_SO=supercontig / SO=protein_coding / is_pseudo=false